MIQLLKSINIKSVVDGEPLTKSDMEHIKNLIMILFNMVLKMKNTVNWNSKGCCQSCSMVWTRRQAYNFGIQ